MFEKCKGLFKFDGIECDGRYCMLGWIKGLLKITSILSVILGVIFFFIILIFGGGPEAPRITSIFALLLGIIYFVMFYVISSLIEILVNIEENTKKTTLLLGEREKK